MRITPARAARNVLRAQLDLDGLADPRSRKGRKHPLAGLVRLVVAGLWAGRLDFRDIEELGEECGPVTLRKLGLRSSPSDTTLYELVRRLDPEPLRGALYRQVRKDIDSKAIKNDLCARGVLTIDGKGAGGGTGPAPNAVCRESVYDDKGSQCWDLYSVRACLTSSSANPVLDQEFVSSKQGEASVFFTLVDRILERFPRLFKVITADAGFTGRGLAQGILDRKRHYLLALKGKHPKQFAAAMCLLQQQPVYCAEVERARGRRVTRRLFRVAVDESFGFPGAREIWMVRQTHNNYRDERVFDEARLFVSSQPPESVSNPDALKLVRLHWGIENGANWTLDMVFKEDTHAPCSKGRGVVVMSWLRLLAYNLLSVLRALFPHRDRRPISWRSATRRAFTALMLMDVIAGAAAFSE